MDQTTKAESDCGFQAKSYGGLEAWSELVLPHPRFGKVVGKQFLGAELGLTGIEVSLNSLAPGQSVPFLHAHRQNEELYLFLGGRGQMLLDNEVLEVTAGTAIRVSPKVMRSWRNTGNEPLACVCIQAKQGSLTQATSVDGFVGESCPVWPT